MARDVSVHMLRLFVMRVLNSSQFLLLLLLLIFLSFFQSLFVWKFKKVHA